MSESKTKKVKDDFSGFSLLKGKFETPEGENEDGQAPDDDVEAGDKGIVEDPDELSEEAKRLAEGDKKLKEVEEVKKKIAAKKKAELEGTDTDEDEESTNDSDSNEDPIVTGLKGFVKNLYDKGTIDFDDTDEEFEASEEGIDKLVDKTVQNRINKWVEQLPDEFQKLLEFTENGGNAKQFLDVYYGNHSWENFKIESEEAQKLAVKESLRLAGESEEDIEEMVTEWLDNGTIEKRAKSAINKLQKHESSQKENIVLQQKEHAKKRFEAEKEYWDGFKKDLYSRDDVMGFKLTPKLKDKIWDSITVIDKKTGKTAYQNAVENKRETQLLFALQAANNFDISKLETQVKTKVSNEFNNLLKNYSKGTKEKISSGRTDEDYSTNPFEAFKNAK